MYIRNLIQLGQVYQYLISNWTKAEQRITVKNKGKVIFDRILVDSLLKVNTVYMYILDNWKYKHVQIFCTD